MSKNTINLLNDGRIEILFCEPIKPTKSLIYDIGWHRGSEIIEEKGKIVGVRCFPRVWRSLLESNAPERLKDFDKVVSNLRKEKNEK